MPTGPTIWVRSSASLTGQPASFDAIAASITCDQVSPLQPKPPPTNGDTTRTLSAATPSVLAAVRRTPEMLWVESYSVSASPSHAAMVAWGSIGWWLSSGVVYVASILVAARSMLSATSPRLESGASSDAWRNDFLASLKLSAAGFAA